MSHRIIQTDNGCTSNPEEWFPRLHIYENCDLMELEGNFMSFNSLPIQEIIMNEIDVYACDNYTFAFKLEKFNTNAYPICYNIMSRFEKLFESEFKEKHVRVEWHYDEENEIMKEEGEDFYDIFIMPIFLVSHT
jgi:hypothetical protein